MTGKDRAEGVVKGMRAEGDEGAAFGLREDGQRGKRAGVTFLLPPLSPDRKEWWEEKCRGGKVQRLY